MEAFRRIRSRRKSKGQNDAFTTFEDAESSYRSDSSTLQNSTLRSSATGPRPSDVTVEAKVNHDYFKQPKSPAAYQRPGTSSHIQPMLVGISRPSMTSSRPDTAESMQRALDRAAESVKYQPARGTSSSSWQVGLRTGRYVDIFATSGQTSKPTRTFNEDVAERNLDAVPLNAEEQHFLYEPGSKFQEEVAARNAHQRGAHRTSSMRRLNTTERVEPTRNRSASAQSGSYAHQSLLQADVTKSRHDQDPTPYHSRQHSSRTRDAPQQLPPIPQERSSEDFKEKDLDKVRAVEKKLERARARWLESRQSSYREESPPDVDKPLPVSPRQKDLSRHLGIPPYANAPSRAHERTGTKPTQKSKHDDARASAYDDDPRFVRPVQRPPSENPAPRQAMHASQVWKRDPAYGAQRGLEDLRPPSKNSNPAYKRMDVGNRTIIDFTADEAASPASYQQTPIVEDAHTGAFGSAIATVVKHSPSPRKSHSEFVSLDPDKFPTLEPVLDLGQLARRSRAVSNKIKAMTAAQGRKAQGRQVQPAATRQSKTPPSPALAFSPIKTPTSYFPPRSIAFSPINTLTSTSPRSSQEILVEESPSTAQGPSTQDIATSGQFQNNDSYVLDAYSSPRANARISADITPLVKVFADVKPEESEATKPLGSGKPRPTRTDSDRRKETSSSSKKEEKRRERSAEAEIRRAAKSIIPAGPLDREPSPAIKTRDFAMVPMVPVERPTNQRIDALVEKKRSQLELKKFSKEPSSSSKSSSSERKGRSRSTRSANKVSFNDDPVSATLHPKPEKKSEKKSSKKKAKSNSSGTHKARSKSLFDEEAFEKKHAEANAALLRLQQSLQQPLEMDTDPLVATPDTETTASRALSPVDSIVPGSSPMPQGSATAAAMAMINSATSSPRPRSRPLYSKSSSDLARKSRSTLPTPAPRSNTEETVTTSKNTTLTATNPVLARIDASGKPPPSPGEVSLSSFPIPTPRAISPESNEIPPAYVKDIGAPPRSGSQASRQSSTSAFSIPFTMVPDRIGSLPENRMGVPALPTSPQIGSIGSIMPPTRSVEVASP